MAARALGGRRAFAWGGGGGSSNLAQSDLCDARRSLMVATGALAKELLGGCVSGRTGNRVARAGKTGGHENHGGCLVTRGLHWPVTNA